MAKHRWGCVKQLAAKYGFHRSAVHRIIKRKGIAVPGPPATQMSSGSRSKPKLFSEHKVLNAEATGEQRAPLSGPPVHAKSQSLAVKGWLRALDDIKDFAVRSSEPRIAQLLDSVIRDMKGKRRGAP